MPLAEQRHWVLVALVASVTVSQIQGTHVRSNNNLVLGGGLPFPSLPSSLAPTHPHQSRLKLRGGEGDVYPTMEELMGGPRSNIVKAIAEKVGRKLHNQVDHPLQIIKTWITQHFTGKNSQNSAPNPWKINVRLTIENVQQAHTPPTTRPLFLIVLTPCLQSYRQTCASTIS